MKAFRLERLQARARRRNGTVKKDAVEKDSVENLATEQHYSVKQVAALWNLSVWTVRRLFATVPGVIRIGTGSHKKVLVPLSVLKREHERLTK